MEQVLQQLQQLNGVYAQLLTTINAQQQHLKLLIHLLQIQQQQTGLNIPSSNDEISNQFVIDGINGFVSSLQQLGGILNSLASSNMETSMTANGMFQSNIETRMPTNGLTQSNTEANTGLLQATQSNAETRMPTNTLTQSNTETNIGLLQATQSNAETRMPTNNFTDGNTLTQIDISKISLGSLRIKIKEFIVKCSRESALAAATILVELYTNPKQSYSSLVKVSGLSIGGLSKHLSMLKRRGLIVKTAYQHLEPTQLALQMMRQSVNRNAE